MLTGQERCANFTIKYGLGTCLADSKGRVYIDNIGSDIGYRDGILDGIPFQVGSGLFGVVSFNAPGSTPDGHGIFSISDPRD